MNISCFTIYYWRHTCRGHVIISVLSETEITQGELTVIWKKRKNNLNICVSLYSMLSI
jgi:hypothetical protein